MGRLPEQTFFQRRDTDGQQAHANMLNITNHQGTANQNHNGLLPHTCQNGYFQKDKNNKCGKDVEEREPLCTVGGNVNWHSYNEKQYGGSSKIKTEQPYDPVILLLHIFPKKIKTLIQKIYAPLCLLQHYLQQPR